APEFEDEAPLKLQGDDAGSAVLGVSGTRALTVERAASATGGIIETVAGSRIATSGSLLLDAPEALRIAGAIDGNGATWALGSSDIVFGGPARSTGFSVGASQLDSLGDAARLQLSASHQIEFAESLNLAGIHELTLNSPRLSAMTSDLDVRFAADSLTLRNGFAASASPAQQGTGTISLSARDVVLGPGSMSVNGFDSFAVSAEREIVGRGNSHFAIGGDVFLNAANIGAASDANLEIVTGGSLSTRSSGTLLDSSRVNRELGGRVALSAGSIDHAGSMRVASGRIELDATDLLRIADTGLLDVSGVTVTAA
ncbi:MAG: hypothetical protein ABUL69_04860, partial [Peristeroidobacter soli]